MENKRQGVAIYCRVSTQEQAVEGVSIDAQLAALRTYSKMQGWEIAGEDILVLPPGGKVWKEGG